MILVISDSFVNWKILQPPIVDLGANVAGVEQTQIFLNAFASDSDGSIVLYQWSMAEVTGESVPMTFIPSDSPSPSIYLPIVDVDTNMTLTALVTDNEGLTASDTIIITVEANTPPSIQFSVTSSTLVVGESSIIDTSATTDIDGDLVITYSWELLSQPEGSLVSLSQADGSSTQLEPDISGDYSIEITASDSIEISTQALTITATPSRFGTAVYGTNRWSAAQ